MMKTFTICSMAILLCLYCGGAWAQIPAEVSCRTEGGVNEAVNRSDSSKLSVRASSPGGKSWIRFQLGSLEVGRLATATLTVTLHEGKTGNQSFDVSFVNDDYRENIGWGEKEITWNNAPGNDPTSYALLDTTKTTLLTKVNFTDGLAGQSFAIDVLPALQSDTDGIVQFVLHNSPNLINLSTHDHANEAYRPVINYTEIPLGAKNPIPGNKARVETTLDKLAWTNPDPNDGTSPITCTIYFGADPNRPEMDRVTLAAGVSSVDLTAANFPRFLPLVDDQQYFWVVDCTDPSMDPGEDVIAGVMWSFFTDNNDAPTVNAGADRAVWLGKSGTAGQEVVHLSGTAMDDGLPEPATLTLLWTQTAGNAVAITPTDQEAASVTITQRGTYEFTLTADDSAKQTADTVRIFVGDNPCDASHLSTGAAYPVADTNQDCLVDLEDFATLIAAHWLTCTDTLTNCGK